MAVSTFCRKAKNWPENRFLPKNTPQVGLKADWGKVYFLLWTTLPRCGKNMVGWLGKKTNLCFFTNCPSLPQTSRLWWCIQHSCSLAFNDGGLFWRPRSVRTTCKMEGGKKLQRMRNFHNLNIAFICPLQLSLSLHSLLQSATSIRGATRNQIRSFFEHCGANFFWWIS